MNAAAGPNWDNVKLIVLIDGDGMHCVRVFEKNWKEWWLMRGREPRYVGVNEPPDFGERIEATGVAAKMAADRFLSSGASQ